MAAVFGCLAFNPATVAGLLCFCGSLNWKGEIMNRIIRFGCGDQNASLLLKEDDNLPWYLALPLLLFCGILSFGGFILTAGVMFHSQGSYPVGYFFALASCVLIMGKIREEVATIEFVKEFEARRAYEKAAKDVMIDVSTGIILVAGFGFISPAAAGACFTFFFIRYLYKAWKLFRLRK